MQGSSFGEQEGQWSVLAGVAQSPSQAPSLPLNATCYISNLPPVATKCYMLQSWIAPFPQALTPKQYACKFDTLALPTAKQIVKNSKHSSECINGSIQKIGRGGGRFLDAYKHN